MYITASSITLKPLTGEVNNVECLLIVAPVARWDILETRVQSFLHIAVLEAGKMGQVNVSDFDKGLIMVARLTKHLANGRSSVVFPVGPKRSMDKDKR